MPACSATRPAAVQDAEHRQAGTHDPDDYFDNRLHTCVNECPSMFVSDVRIGKLLELETYILGPIAIACQLPLCVGGDTC